MKINKFAVYVLSILPLIITIIALFFLPDKIAAHYDVNNQVDRYGSKYESLILPFFTLLFGLFMHSMIKFSTRNEKPGSDNENTLIRLTNISLLVFNLMTGFFLYTAFHQVGDLSSTPIDLSQLTIAALGIGMIFIGPLMPKLGMNSLIGIRTPWSMKNEDTWKKCQHFGGFSFLFAGILIILSCFLFKGIPCTICAVIIILVVMVIDMLYSYWVAREN